jgi:hypothetical protein
LRDKFGDANMVLLAIKAEQLAFVDITDKDTGELLLIYPKGLKQLTTELDKMVTVGEAKLKKLVKFELMVNVLKGEYNAVKTVEAMVLQRIDGNRELKVRQDRQQKDLEMRWKPPSTQPCSSSASRTSRPRRSAWRGTWRTCLVSLRVCTPRRRRQ